MEANTTENHQNRTDRFGDEKIVKYLVFKLSTESYAVPLSSVREVIGVSSVTRMPNTASHFLGVINLRGKIISIFDFRIKLGIAQTEFVQGKSSTVIVEIGGYSYGVIVDDVVEVAGFTSAQIDTDIDCSNRFNNKTLYGVVRSEQMVMLLNVGHIFHGGQENDLMIEAAKAQAAKENAVAEKKVKEKVEEKAAAVEEETSVEADCSFGIFDDDEDVEEVVAPEPPKLVL